MQTVAYALCVLAAATGDGGMFYSGQSGEIASAGGDDQAVIPDLAAIGLDHPAAIPDACCRTLMKYHLFAAEKILQLDRDIVSVADARRNPDEAGVIEKFRLPADDGDFGRRLQLAQHADSGQASEAGAYHGNAFHA